MIYIIKDFLLSRNGKVLILCAFIVVAAFYASRHSKGKSTASLPPKHQSDLWSDELDDRETPFKQISENRFFESFVPVSPKPETIVIKEPTSPNKIHILPPKKVAVIYHAPLIKEQHPRPLASLKDKTPSSLPTLEEGALIYCRLLSPASTDFNGALVTAETTRPVIRNGITLIPQGSKLNGSIQTSKNDRIFFAPGWRIRLSSGKQLNITAHSQERSYNLTSSRLNPSDGRTGLPGEILNETLEKRSNVLTDMTKAFARFGKETVRTGIGEFVPATGRNLALEGSSIAIEQLMKKDDMSTANSEPIVHVPAGQEFYLVVSTANKLSEIQSSEDTDQLLREFAMKRLGEIKEN